LEGSEAGGDDSVGSLAGGEAEALSGAGGADGSLASGTASASAASGGLSMSQDPCSPVSHILFIVHGMGATPETLRRNVREVSNNLMAMQKYWFWHVNINVHVEMIDWKSSFSELQGSIFDRITPGEARGMRMSLNSTLSDVIFYKTPHHRSRIHEIVTNRMNTRLDTLRLDPSGRFADAGVSIVGHSLGSVIAYDVLAGYGSDEDSPALEFEVDHFFLWGSPLGAFLSIADIEHQSGKFVLPRTLNTYNVFHPHDPVAFRLEPLYYHTEEQAAPETIAYWANNGVRPSKQWAQTYEYAKGLAHQKWTAFTSRMWEVVGTSSKAEVLREQWDSYLNNDRGLSSTGASSWRGKGMLVGPDGVDDSMRVDYSLQELALEAYVESYGLLQSHFCYWNSHDVGLFMLKKMTNQDTAELNADERDKMEAQVAAAAAKASAAAIADPSEEGDEVLSIAATPSPSQAEGPLAMLQNFDIGGVFVRHFADTPCVKR